MQNIRKIFFRDVAALLKNPFALIIAGGLCILPALYAWFNIYSNWDPYGNTGNIKIAAASKDRGYTDAQGSSVNVADTVMKTLKENKRKKVNSPPSKLFPGIFLLTNLFERFIIAPTRKTVEKEE